MFLKRLSVALVTITCLGWAAMGAAPNTLTSATNNGIENSALVPLAFGAQITGIAYSCNDNPAKGTINVVITDGVAPFNWTLHFSNGATERTGISASLSSFPISNVSAGNYYLTVTDINHSSPEQSNTITIVEPNPVVVSLVSLTPIKCTNGTGGITITAKSDVNIGTYYIQKQGSSQPLSNSNGVFSGSGVTAGNYNAWAVDISGCSGYYTGATVLKLVEPSDLSTVTIIPSPIACFGKTGSAELVNLPENSGINAYSIELKNSRTPSTNYSLVSGNTFIGLDWGNYTLTLNRTGCTPPVTKTFVIDQVSDITINASIVTPIKCFGGSTSVNVTVGGGKAGKNFHLVLDNGDGDPDNDKNSTPFVYGSSFSFSPVFEGNYIIRCIDEEEPTCLKEQPISVGAPKNPLVYLSDPKATAVSCFNSPSPDGKITFYVTGGTGTITYLVDGNSYNSNIVTGLSAGSHVVSVFDGAGCFIPDTTIVIESPLQLVVTHDPSNDVDVTCPKGNNGEIRMKVSGGVGGYKYDLALSGASIIRPNVSTDSNIVISALTVGKYDVQVKDKNSCQANPVKDIAIDEPDDIVIAKNDFVLDTIKCNGEKATLRVKANGGSDPKMTYKLYRGTTFIKTIASTGIVTFPDLIPSSYTLKVWSNIACKDSLIKPFTVVDRKKLEVINVLDSMMVKCPGDVPTFTLTVSGEAPFTYSIDGTAIQNVVITGNTVIINNGLTSSVAGSLNKIVVKDKYNCENEVFVTFYDPKPIVTTALNITDVKCKSGNSGSVSLNITGGTPGYSLNLTDGVNTFKETSTTGLNAKLFVPAGTYNLEIKDRNECIAPNPPAGIVVKEPDSLKVGVPQYSPILCFGEATLVTFPTSGGWPVNKFIKVLGEGVDTILTTGTINKLLRAGNYTISATNADGCSSSKYTLKIEQPTKLVLNPPVVDNVSCFKANDAKITFTVTGGTPDYQYGLGGNGSAGISFSGTGYTISTGLVAADYKLVVKDANSCESNIVPVTITEPTKVDFTYSTDSVTCFGASDGKITVSGSGGNDNSYVAYLNGVKLNTYPILNGLKAGSYTVKVTDSKDCTSETKTIIIGQPDVIVINWAIISDSVSCNNDQDASITINAIGGSPYSLQYKITGTINRNYQYSNKFTGLQGGDYDVFVSLINKGVNYCEAKFPTRLNITNPEKISLKEDIEVTDVSCHNLQDGTVTIKAKGGTGSLNYSLVNAPVSIQPNPNSAGRFSQLGDLNQPLTKYNYKVEDTKGCILTGNFNISNPPELKIEALDHHQVICNNKNDGWILVKATGGVGKYTYKNNSVNSDTIRISNGEYLKEQDSRIKMLKLSGGDYYPEVIDGNGCTATITGAITIVNPPPLRIADVRVGDKKCFDSKDDETLIIIDPKDFGTRGTYKYTINNWVRNNETTDLQSSFLNVRDTMVYAKVKDAEGCIAEFEPMAVGWPEAFNAQIKQLPITCWDNQYGSLVTNFTGGTMPYSISVNDILFGKPILIDKVVPGAVVIDTIEGNENGVFYEGVKTEIFVKDANGCVALNSGNKNIMNPYFYNEYTWDAIDTFAVTDIISTSPGCSYIEASLQIIIEKGEPPYSYWAQYWDGKEYITADSGSHSLLDVPADKIMEWYVTDKNSCAAYVDLKVDPQGKQQIYIPATADTIEVSSKINNDELPQCPLTKDGIVRINMKGYSSEGVEVKIYKTDSTFTDFNSFNPEHLYLITAAEKDSFYWHEKVNILTGEKVYSDTLYTVTNDSIKYLFSVGYYFIEFLDIKSGCIVSTQFELTPKDSICPNNFNLIFSPNGDKENDEWVLNNLHLKNASLKIFNSEGELVYHFPKGGQGFATNGLKWDGFDDKGRPAPIGTYMYVYMMDAVESKVEYGTITLIRGRN